MWKRNALQQILSYIFCTIQVAIEILSRKLSELNVFLKFSNMVKLLKKYFKISCGQKRQLVFGILELAYFGFRIPELLLK